MELILTPAPMRHAQQRAEICEHKGIGHPDSLCDGVADAVSQALCAAYLREYGEIRHHNVDKALLIGGQSTPAFGGGRVDQPIRLIVAGRADPLPNGGSIADLVHNAARDYLVHALRFPAAVFRIEPAVRPGSLNLRRVVASDVTVPVANDTSFGVGFAPYSPLEQTVLRLSEHLRSASFREAFPMAGDDFKIMGRRIDDRVGVTIALAFMDWEVNSVAHYFSRKAEMVHWLGSRLDQPCDIRINTLDDPNATDETGLYLTVTGLSAEHGDDGQVGRGNRVSGLITPFRAMSLEAAAGKNPVSHVGKIYNVLATTLANALVARIPEIEEAQVQLLSAIGQPVNRPQLVAIALVTADGRLDEVNKAHIEDLVRACLDDIPALSAKLAHGEYRVF
ncbi:methionine adenosyltransferase [Herbaspirillum sp. ST 5-3]|uniref:methionine adenosyltransferase n=1 Tax=Oxalobacteraceae TaxID=75682 RepID=UPI0010A2EBBA|nr:methionine adenosyltransferase [Herbaspirillum sp. ST 5-3]